MAKQKAGLHKRVSTIFDGVPVPGGAAQAGPAEQVEPSRIRLDRPEQPAPAGPAKPPASTAEPGTALPQKPKPKPSAVLPRSQPGKRQRPMLFLFLVLCVILVAVLYRAFKPVPEENQPEKVVTFQPIPQIVALPDSDIEIKVDWQIPPAYPAKLRDPMYIPRKATAGTGAATTTGAGGQQDMAGGRLDEQLIVKSIFYSEQGRSAVVGDSLEIVYEGQEVFGAKVIKIDKDSVEFEMNGVKFTRFIDQRTD